MFVFCADEELLIVRSIYKGMIHPGEEKQMVECKSSTTSLDYAIRVRCDEHYYSPKCNKVCRPRDDYFGHYVCDQFGNRECMDGWTNLTSSCKTGRRKVIKTRLSLQKKKKLVCCFPYVCRFPVIHVIVILNSCNKVICKRLMSERCILYCHVFTCLWSYALSFPSFSFLTALYGNTSEVHRGSCQESLCKNSKNV